MPPTMATPHHRVLVTVDIEGSTTRTNPAKAQLRRAMYELVEAALEACGIAEQHRDPMIDRGDGVLIVIHPVDQAPKTLLLNTLVPTLSALLGRYNTGRPEESFRLRAAVHAGEALYDRQGRFGEALDITFRLLDAPAVKGTLSRSGAPLVLVVSDDIYRTVIRHRYAGIDDRAFEQIVRVNVAGQVYYGWVHGPA